MAVIPNAICKLAVININCQVLCARRVSTAVLNASPKITLEEKVGIQRRPKRPMSAFIKYAMERRPVLVQQNPNSKLGDLMKIASEEWKNLDTAKKNIFYGQFKKDWSKYLEDCKKYDEMLSPGEKEKIMNIKEEAEILQAKKMLKKKREELGCPKKPGSSYMYFMRAKLPERGDQPFLDFQRKLKDDWQVLPPSEKKQFDEMYKKDLEIYKERMTEWNKQMLAKGNKDVELDSSPSRTDTQTVEIIPNTSTVAEMEVKSKVKHVTESVDYSNNTFVNKEAIYLLLISSCVAVVSFMYFFVFY